MISHFARSEDPVGVAAEHEDWIPDDAFLRTLERLGDDVKARMDAAAAKAAEEWAERKYEDGEWIRPENIAASFADAVAQVDEFLPPPPVDSIGDAEPSEMLRRWALSPYNPKSNPTYLNEPESD